MGARSGVRRPSISWSTTRRLPAPKSSVCTAATFDQRIVRARRPWTCAASGVRVTPNHQVRNQIAANSARAISTDADWNQDDERRTLLAGEFHTDPSRRFSIPIMLKGASIISRWGQVARRRIRSRSPDPEPCR